MSSPALPFRRRDSSAAALRDLVLSQCIDVRLQKAERTRRYWIRPGRQPGEWYCQVWFGEKAQHRGDITTDHLRAQRTRIEYLREVEDLCRDGWAVSQGMEFL